MTKVRTVTVDFSAETSTPPIEVLLEASRLPKVAAGMRRAHEALAALRFHEGLRRRWAEARAESALREATGVALSEGIRITVGDLRAYSLSEEDTDPQDPGTALARGIWRAQWNLASTFPPLNAPTPHVERPRPLPALLAGIHRDICSGLVAAGHLNTSTVAVPASPEAVSSLATLLAAQLPVPVCAAEIVARFHTSTLFVPASGAVGWALARHVLVTRGVDPSGVAVVSASSARDPYSMAAGLDAWRSRTVNGVGQWLLHYADSLVEGAHEGEDVALRIQAGRIGD